MPVSDTLCAFCNWVAGITGSRISLSKVIFVEFFPFAFTALNTKWAVSL